MGWKQFFRALEAANHRAQRQAARGAREAQREAARFERQAMQQFREQSRRERELAKQAAKLEAANEADKFEKYVELLVSIHKDCGSAIDWAVLAGANPPVSPVRGEQHERVAALDLESYRPGLVDRMFGGARKKQAALLDAVVRGRAADAAAHAEATRAYEESYASWNARKALADRVIARDTSAYPIALMSAGSLDELSAFQTEVSVGSNDPNAVAFTCNIMDDEVVPREEVKLTAAGKLSTKAMPAGRYWALYQDHICSTAIRLAREAFAVLPVSRAVVNIGPVQVNTQTGHKEPVTFLAVHFARDILNKLNLGQIDPSDSMKNFPNRMKFKKTAGFEPVQPMILDEQWITTP